MSKTKDPCPIQYFIEPIQELCDLYHRALELDNLEPAVASGVDQSLAKASYFPKSFIAARNLLHLLTNFKQIEANYEIIFLQTDILDGVFNFEIENMDAHRKIIYKNFQRQAEFYAVQKLSSIPLPLISKLQVSELERDFLVTGKTHSDRIKYLFCYVKYDIPFLSANYIEQIKTFENCLRSDFFLFE
ncbi:MAG: hypothetical protein AAF429_04970 [Pseudomonadota bacterium]